ncbi:hypothetical protein BHE74_00023003 [Ensete ventricosum]|nr:hypothetical protein BHE74_00023003 [Ensete ventricosum]
MPKFALSAKSPRFVPEFALSARPQDQFPSPCSVGSAPASFSSRATARPAQSPSSCSVGSTPKLLLGRISSCFVQLPSYCSVRSAPASFSSRATARSNQLPNSCSVGSAPASFSSRATARSDQFASSCSVGSTPASISSRATARSDQFPSSCSVGSFPSLARFDQFLSSDSVGSTTGCEARPTPLPSPARSDQFLSPRSVRSTPARSDQSAFRTSLTSPQTAGSAQDLIFSTLIRHLEKVFPGGKNDLANVDLAATSSRPRTIGPSTWPTRHGEAGLTQAWRSQRSYGRPDTGKVGKVDTPYLQARTSPQGLRTACVGLEPRYADVARTHGERGTPSKLGDAAISPKAAARFDKNMTSHFPTTITFLLILVLLLSNSASASAANDTGPATPSECDAASLGECYNKPEALRLKLIAIGTILVASMIGVCLPLFSRAVPALRPDRNLFVIVKAFASGVILATGYMHVLPDSFENLSSPCLPKNPWSKFPFTAFVAMLSAIFTLMVDSLMLTFYNRRKVSKATVMDHESPIHEMVPVPHGHGHGHGHCGVPQLDADGKDAQEAVLLRNRIIAQVSLQHAHKNSLLHSSHPISSNTISISYAEYGIKMKAILAFFFATTTPFGVALGIGLSNVYRDNSPTALIVIGLLNASSAGLLNYMALVDLLATDFMGPKLQGSVKLQLWAYLAVLLGSGGMSLMAKWA